MRFMIKAMWDVEAGNQVIRDGVLGEKVEQILAELQPEATYFTAEGGKRGCTMIVQMQDASEIPAVAEPFFLIGNASVEILPVMLPEDLAKAGDAIGRAVEKYG